MVRTMWLLALVMCVLAAHAQEAAPSPPPAESDVPSSDEGPIPIDQVQIQVWIGETNEKGLGEIGTNLTYTRFVREVEQSGSLQQVDTNVFDPNDPLYSVVLPAPDPDLFPAPMRFDPDGDPATGIQTQGGAGLVASIINSDYGTIVGRFRAIERQSDLDLISKPELVVANQKEAEIHAGGEVPYQDIKYEKGKARLNVEWHKIGVNMKLTPLIVPGNTDFVQITLSELNVSDITRIDNIRGVDLPVFSERSQTGVVIVPNGQTLVIGGLTSSVVSNSERRVPILGKLPIVGMPFRGRRSDTVNTTLLIFVSPTIVNLRSIAEEAVKARDFWQGWQNAERIQQEIKALETPDEF